MTDHNPPGVDAAMRIANAMRTLDCETFGDLMDLWKQHRDQASTVEELVTVVTAERARR